MAANFGVLVIGISDTRVHHAAQRVAEALRDFLQLVELQIAVIELPISHPLANDVGD